MNTSGIKPSELGGLLKYEPDTGRLFWKDRPDEMFATKRSAAIFRARFVGKEAFTATLRNGDYKVGTIFGRQYCAHRVIYAIQTLAWPKHDVDHINRDRTDNRWSNLRSATRSQNMCNNDFLCVRETASGKWSARVAIGGNRRHLGVFACRTAALVAQHVAAIRLHGDFARMGVPV